MMESAAALLVELFSFVRCDHACVEASEERLPVAQEVLEQARAVACVVKNALFEPLYGFKNEAVEGEDREAERLLLVALVDIDEGLRWRDEAALDAILQYIDRLSQPFCFGLSASSSRPRQRDTVYFGLICRLRLCVVSFMWISTRRPQRTSQLKNSGEKDLGRDPGRSSRHAAC